MQLQLYLLFVIINTVESLTRCYYTINNNKKTNCGSVSMDHSKDVPSIYFFNCATMFENSAISASTFDTEAGRNSTSCNGSRFDNIPPRSLHAHRI